MLTVLTQTPAFVLGNGNEDYGHPGCPFDMRSQGLLRPVSLQLELRLMSLWAIARGTALWSRAPLRAPTMRTVKRQSKASSIRWPFASGNSWWKAAIGWELPRTFCVLLSLMMSRAKAGG